MGALLKTLLCSKARNNSQRTGTELRQYSPKCSLLPGADRPISHKTQHPLRNHGCFLQPSSFRVSRRLLTTSSGLVFLTLMARISAFVADAGSEIRGARRSLEARSYRSAAFARTGRSFRADGLHSVKVDSMGLDSRASTDCFVATVITGSGKHSTSQYLVGVEEPGLAVDSAPRFPRSVAATGSGLQSGFRIFLLTEGINLCRTSLWISLA